MDPLGIEGAWISTPNIHHDDRGSFLENFHGGDMAEHLGYGLEIAQVNWSVSRRGVIRGIHFADVPPGQAKYVSCVHGAIMDVVVDLRVGSSQFGKWEAVRLDDESRRSIFIAEGLGHAFMALTDECTVVYLCSTSYTPGREHGIDPLDPSIGIDWPADIAPILSLKDSDAPSLAEALHSQLLPQYSECVTYTTSLRAGDPAAVPRPPVPNR